MEIRRYREGEEERLWAIFFETSRVSNARDYHPDLIARWAPEDKDMGEWRERVRRTRPFVAEVESGIAGFAELVGDGDIDYFYVHPDWQGKGVGKALLSELESEASRLGIRKIYADVSVTAERFFSSRGFHVTESREKVILGHPAPNFAMEKVLEGGETDWKKAESTTEA